MKTIYTLLFTLMTATVFAAGTEIRFAEATAIDGRVFVDVEVRSTDDDFVLGGQNLRAYFNSASLSFVSEASSSRLGAGTYGALKVVTHLENIDADQIGQLTFDDNLGFINLAIELEDVIGGGITVSDDWTAIATLAFDINDEDASHDLVWAREGAGDAYATAFVQMTEWKSASNVVDRAIDEYIDFEMEIKEEKASQEYTITVGPNPTQDYIQISQNAEKSDIIIVDMTGQVVVEQTITDAKTRISLETMNSGNYMVYMTNGSETLTERIMKIN